MPKVWVAYAPEFNVPTKLARKLDRLFQSLDCVELVCATDPNGLLADYAQSRGHNFKLDVDGSTATHAVFFGDPEFFDEAAADLKETDCSIRWVRNPITRVINLDRPPYYRNMPNSETYHYCGRGGYWGNPYSRYDSGETREDVIHKYAYDFERDIFPNKEKAKVFELLGKRLGCFCVPKPCHARVLADYLNAYDDGA